MKILLVAPNAPPKNSPEAIQVGRFLAALDPSVRVTLVTTPITRGWVRQDTTLAVERPGLHVLTPKLPFHHLAARMLSSRHLYAFHVPDTDFWLPWYADRVARLVKDRPDVIYSRSSPFSGALLADRFKEFFGCPWLMHLSDPWASNPYRAMSPRRASVDRELEGRCVRDADLISLTTEGQAAHYRAKYPERAGAVIVTPNMLPQMQGIQERPLPSKNELFRIVYAGALYGAREPSTLLHALQVLRDRTPSLAQKVAVEFFGNMPPDMAKSVDATPECYRHGPVSYETALRAQLSADALLTIEPDGVHPLHLHFMPSKNLDYMACRRPILAVTPSGSETARLCAAGYGWAVSPGDVEGLAEKLSMLVHAHEAGDLNQIPPDPSTSPYLAGTVASTVLDVLRGLVECSGATETSL